MSDEAMNKNPFFRAAWLDVMPGAWFGRIPVLTGAIGLLWLSQWLVLPAAATPKTWVSGSSGKWSVDSNWSPAGAPANGDDLHFEPNGSVSVMTNDIGGLTVGGLYFNQSKTLYGNVLGVAGPVVQNNLDASPVNLNLLALVLSNNVTFLSAHHAGMNVNCQVLLNNHNLFASTVDTNGGTLEFQASITGNGTLVCAGGTNIFLRDFAYPSYPIPHVLVNAGQLNIGYDRTNAIGESLEIGPGGTVSFDGDNQIDWHASVLIHEGGALKLNDHFNYFRNLEMQGGLLDCGPQGNILLSDDIRINATNETAIIRGHCTISIVTNSIFTEPHPRLTVNGTIYPALDIQATVYGLGGFSKSGNGAMYLSVSNYFLGQLVISNGIVEARNNYALGFNYTSAGGDFKGVRLAGGTVLLRNAVVPGRELYVEQPVNSSGTFELPGAFITSFGNSGWSGDVILSTNLNVIGDVNFSGAISGPGGLAFFGGGISTLGGNNANSYAGRTLVRCPLLQFAKPYGVRAYASTLEIGGGAGGPYEARWLSHTQSVNATVTLFDNGILNLNNYSEDFGPITFTGGQIQTGFGELGANGLITVNESDYLASISGRVRLPAGSREFRVQGDGLVKPGLEISATVSGTGQITKTGGGMLKLSGASTYSGLTLITEGWLSASNPSALGAGDPGTIVNDGATLQLNSLGATPMQERISIRGQGVAGYGALEVIGLAQLRTLFPTLYACLNLTTNATINVVGASSRLVCDGFISGSGTLTKIGAGTLVFTNSVANTFVGDTFVREGTLELRKPNNTTSLQGQLTLGPSTAANQGIVRFYQTGGAPVLNTVTANANSILDLNGNNLNLSQLFLNDGGSVQTGAGTLLFAGGGAITIGTSNSPIQGLRQGASISGKVQLPSFDTLYCHVLNYGPAPLTSEPELAISASISGTGNLFKDGGGALRLTGNNSFNGTAQVYSGEVDVMAGTLIAGSALALGGVIGETYVANGASLALINGISIANETLVLNSTNNAALDNRGGNNTWSGPIQFSRDSAISVAQDWELNCAGVISGSGSMTKWGAGTLRYSGSANNSYNGDTLVNAGTLLLAKSIAVTAVPNFVVVGESGGGGAPATNRNANSYQVFGGIIVNSQGVYDVNGQQENTDYLGLNGNASLVTGTGYFSLKVGASVAVAPGSNTTATINGHVLMDSGTHVFTVGSGAATPSVSDLVINAQIEQISAAAGIQKGGPGSMRLAGNNTYTGTNIVSGGTLQVDGSQPQSPVQILGARLQGSGTVGHITFSGNAAERLAPGNSPGVLTCSNFNANAVGGATLEMELNGASPGTGYDQVNARGTVNLTGLKLNPSLGFAPAISSEFTLINNDGSDPVIGTFSGLPQNGKVYIGGQFFQINYAGGSGNDVVLTRLATPPPPALTFERASTNSIRLLWPTNDPPFRLVSATNLSATNWTPTLPLPSVIGNNNVVTNTLGLPQNFYRLVTP